MMTRSCALCGSVKTGLEAEIKAGGEAFSVALDHWWRGMHKPGCRYLEWSASERTAYFMEHGSPLSSVEE
jgi:hypothetical protein